jgi:hypothetical protein
MNAGVAPPASPRAGAAASTPHPAAIPLLHRLWEMKLLLCEQKIAVMMNAYRQGKEKPVAQVASIDAEIDRLSLEIQAEKEHMYYCTFGVRVKWRRCQARRTTLLALLTVGVCMLTVFSLQFHG